ncbi:PAS domain S-box protein [Rubrivirga sp. IMCC43871]|uniref:PAS domain-containing sensor histidine kinase n=1 Tax=Rubrivirga sp. IMCC43871 TaxID=3391575 RepID=UPI00398FD6B7
MPAPGPIVWSGPLTPFADALGDRRAVDAPSALGYGDAELVVLASGTGDLADWLRRPRSRPPVLVIAATPEAEDAALARGAEGVVGPGAGEREAARAARHARARHAYAQTDAELYRLMVESVADLVTVVDASGRTEYASPSALEQTGRTPEQIVTEPTFEAIHPDDLDRVLTAFTEGFLTGERSTMRYRVIDPDGRTRVLESRGRAAVGPGGVPYGIVTSRDVTARAETERRLVESESRYRTVVRALPDVVSRLRTDGMVLDFHVPAQFETEFAADALIGKRLQDVIPDDLAAKFEAAAAQIVSSGQPVAYDYETASDGRRLFREVRMAPVGNGEVLSMLRDVTPLREHEEALERSRAELRALATHLQDIREEERTRLSREVHDVLGQQLTAIRLGIGWFGRHYADDAPALARLESVRETIDETIRHVREIASGLRPGVLDDFGLASAATWQAKRFEERTGTTCRVDVQGAFEPPTDVATAAFRVLQEALTNVARHAGASRVAVTLVMAPTTLRLVVADDGRGFDPARTRRRSLGLVGMRERAGALGGTLDVDGTPGQGTRVECTFPLPSADVS